MTTHTAPLPPTEQVGQIEERERRRRKNESIPSFYGNSGSGAAVHGGGPPSFSNINDGDDGMGSTSLSDIEDGGSSATPLSETSGRRRRRRWVQYSVGLSWFKDSGYVQFGTRTVRDVFSQMSAREYDFLTGHCSEKDHDPPRGTKRKNGRAHGLDTTSDFFADL